MANFSKVHVARDARTELHDKLSLTGAEVSINHLPAEQANNQNERHTHLT